MEIGDIVFLTIDIGLAIGLWILLTKSQKNQWTQSKRADLISGKIPPGVQSNFNGIEMYSGDPGLVPRVEKKLKDMKQ